MLDEQGFARMRKALGIGAEHARELVETFDIGPAPFEALDKRARKMSRKPLVRRHFWSAPGPIRTADLSLRRTRQGWIVRTPKPALCSVFGGSARARSGAIRADSGLKRQQNLRRRAGRRDEATPGVRARGGELDERRADGRPTPPAPRL
jgi:hypothetical protein